jgi:hypothetical protein
MRALLTTEAPVRTLTLAPSAALPPSDGGVSASAVRARLRASPSNAE